MLKCSHALKHTHSFFLVFFTITVWTCCRSCSDFFIIKDTFWFSLRVQSVKSIAVMFVQNGVRQNSRNPARLRAIDCWRPPRQHTLITAYWSIHKRRSEVKDKQKEEADHWERQWEKVGRRVRMLDYPDADRWLRDTPHWVARWQVIQMPEEEMGKWGDHLAMHNKMLKKTNPKQTSG